MLTEADIVWAMHPHDQQRTVPLILHPQTEAKLFQAGYGPQIGDYWGLIHGRPPNAGQTDPEATNRFPAPKCSQVLRDPHAIYRDLKRPMRFVHMDADKDVIIYVAKRPPNTYLFKRHRDFGGILETKEPPISSVFTAYASFHRAHVDDAMGRVHTSAASPGGSFVPEGVLLSWEWIQCPEKEPELPEDHATRYSEKLL